MAPNHTTVATDSRRPSAASRSALVYQQLRALLMDGSVAPTERLTEEALADRFEVSRTPVREALSRLQTDGLIERRDGGLYLLIPSFDTLAELYELRITLELRGIQRAIDDRSLHHDHAVLDAELAKWYGLRTALPAPDAGFVSTDEAFHQTLLRSSGNEALVDALRNVNRRIRPIRMYDYLTEDRIDATIAEHIAIAELVRDDDLSAALAALREHVEESRQVVMERAAAALPFTRRPGLGSRP